MKRVSVPLFAAAGIAVLLLTGCSDQAGLKALERTATPEDTLPATVNLSTEMNRDSSRLLATQDGVQFFGIQSGDASTTCVAVVPPGEDPAWQVGCGDTRGSGEITKISSVNTQLSTILLGDDFDTGKLEPGWTKIADNILISAR